MKQPNIDIEKVRDELARRNLLDFAQRVSPEFVFPQYQKNYIALLDKFAKGEIKKLMISMPPQHAKSENSTRKLPAFIHGLDPNRKIAIGSYNTTFARKFNRDIQRIIDNHKYHSIFPETTLNNSNIVTVSSSYLRNSEEFEIVDYKGSLKAVGRGGALTGNPVDVMIMDDLYKDKAEGNSPVIREAVWDWYTSVVKTRLHNDSQELIVFTRWHEDDLIGRLEKKEIVYEINSLTQLEELPKKAWVKINFEAIKTQGVTEIDPREKGLPLWPEKHSLELLKEKRDLDNEDFNCLYQGNPVSQAGLLYNKFKTYSELPETGQIESYTDTADTGQDYLCSIVYTQGIGGDDNIYVLDILYTSEPMDLTEQWCTDMFNRNGVRHAYIESNNGGRGFARAVENMVNSNCVIDWFYQGQNKESRIHTRKSTVQKRIIFPRDWSVRWPEFYEHLTYYKKLFKANKQDGAPDVLTGIIEKTEGEEFWIM